MVDRDRAFTDSVGYALRSKEFEVFTAHDGNDGLIMIEREDPDLLLLEIMLPKRSGFLVVETLRMNQLFPLKIIICTANEGKRHKVYAESLGVDDYIRKPFPMSLLLDSVDRLLSD